MPLRSWKRSNESKKSIGSLLSIFCFQYFKYFCDLLGISLVERHEAVDLACDHGDDHRCDKNDTEAKQCFGDGNVSNRSRAGQSQNGGEGEIVQPFCAACHTALVKTQNKAQYQREGKDIVGLRQILLLGCQCSADGCKRAVEEEPRNDHKQSDGKTGKIDDLSQFLH